MNLLTRSLQLDIEFLAIKRISLFKKVIFIVSKYILLVKNFLLGFYPGKSFIKIFGRKYYFEDKFGVAFLQSVYVDNAFLAQFIQKGATVIDVGANIGQFNFFCKEFLGASKVYSFEPLRNTFKILKKNSPDDIYNYAVSSKKYVNIFTSETSLTASSIQTRTDHSIEKVRCVELDTMKPIQALGGG